MVFKRKIYDRLLEWKENWAGKRALLVQGARRIGKSTIVEQFAKNEYETYILRKLRLKHYTAYPKQIIKNAFSGEKPAEDAFFL